MSVTEGNGAITHSPTFRATATLDSAQPTTFASTLDMSTKPSISLNKLEARTKSLRSTYLLSTGAALRSTRSSRRARSAGRWRAKSPSTCAAGRRASSSPRRATRSTPSTSRCQEGSPLTTKDLDAALQFVGRAGRAKALEGWRNRARDRDGYIGLPDKAAASAGRRVSPARADVSRVRPWSVVPGMAAWPWTDTATHHTPHLSSPRSTRTARPQSLYPDTLGMPSREYAPYRR